MRRAVKKVALELEIDVNIRLNMSNLKANFKKGARTLKCQAGCNSDETTEHIICDKSVIDL